MVINEIKSTGGEEKVTLGQYTIPSHFHTINLFDPSIHIDDYIDKYKIEYKDLGDEKNATNFPGSLTFQTDIIPYKLTTLHQAENIVHGYDYSYDLYSYYVTRNNLHTIDNNIITSHSQSAHENMPPWCSLYYIMKLR